MYSALLYIAFFLSGTTACSAGTVWDMPIPDVQQKIAAGDYSFFEHIPDDKLHEITKISPQMPFFAAQYLLDTGDTGKAALILAAGAKKSPPPYNRLCAFLQFESAADTDRIKYGEAYCKTWQEDKAAVAILASAYADAGQMYKAGNIAKKFGITDRLFTDIPAAVALSRDPDGAALAGHYISMRLLQSGQTLTAPVAALCHTYFAYFPVTAEYRMAMDKYVRAVPLPPPPEMRTTALIARARNMASQKQYTDALPLFSVLITAKQTAPLPEPVLSAAGKTFLYGSANADDRAADIWQQQPDSYMKFFYCGRLSAKQNSHQQAARFFRQAADMVLPGKQKDTAIWYELTETAAADFDAVHDVLQHYQTELTDPDYFADFFESYITQAMQKEAWNTVARLYYRFNRTVDENTAARLAYITARGLENGRITEFPAETPIVAGEPAAAVTKQLVSAAYTSAYISEHASFYYRILAGRRLGQKDETALLFKHSIQPPPAPARPLPETGTPESLLPREECIRGYLDHNMKNRAYDLIFKKDISLTTDSLFEFSRIYRDRFSDYQKSIRIAVEAINAPDRPLTDEELQLAYPNYYRQEITAAAAKYNLAPDLLYGLIRTESYFNANIVSSAGAIGLMQLMETTAADIARRLKTTDYVLTDPQTNITFGTFYLARLLRRLDGNIQDAVFAYNGGISRVRRWHNQQPDSDDDLFLETVPIEETRDYGRKVLAAAAVYRYLYYTNTK